MEVVDNSLLDGKTLVDAAIGSKDSEEAIPVALGNHALRAAPVLVDGLGQVARAAHHEVHMDMRLNALVQQRNGAPGRDSLRPAAEWAGRLV